VKRVTVVVTLGKADWPPDDKQLRRLQRVMMAAAHDECDEQDHEIVAIQGKIVPNAKVVKSL
jgi:hypothetical protein